MLSLNRNPITGTSYFGSVKEAVKMDANDMKVAVYHGNVAVVTFHSDFHFQFEEEQAVVNDQISLVFVKNSAGEWKIVQEHHSPLNVVQTFIYWPDTPNRWSSKQNIQVVCKHISTKINS